MPLKLIIANKAYSSWSLRPWILLGHFKIPFEEVVIPLDAAETRANILKYAPSGKCPSLQRRRDRGLGVARDHRICRRDASRRRRSGRAERRRGRMRARWRAKCTPASRRCGRRVRPISAVRRARSRSASRSGPTSRGSKPPGATRARHSARPGRSCSGVFRPPTPCSRRSSTASTSTTSRSESRRAPIWRR